jgi:chromosome partitioning protein
VPAGPHVIVFANEKGGTGKSTTAVHVAIALAAKGAQGRLAGPRSPPADLRTLSRQSRGDGEDASGKRVADARSMRRSDGTSEDGLRRKAFASTDRRIWTYLVDRHAGARRSDFARIPPPALSNTLVTPMNDSFVDFDLIGQVHPETFKVTQAQLLFRADLGRTQAACQASMGCTIDWVVLRNRLQHIEARNMRRVSEALDPAGQAGRFPDHSRASANASSIASCSPPD